MNDNLPNRENVFIRLALRNGSNLRFTRGIPPSPKQFSLFHIPAENFLTCTDNSSSGTCLARRTCTDLIVSGPYRIRRRGRNEAESIRMLEFPKN
jgi:hypothetical protein